METVARGQLLGKELDLLFKVAYAEDVVGEQGAAWVVAGDAFEDFAVGANFGFSFLGFGLLGDGKHFVEQNHELGRRVVVDGRAPQLLT